MGQNSAPSMHSGMKIQNYWCLSNFLTQASRCSYSWEPSSLIKRTKAWLARAQSGTIASIPSAFGSVLSWCVSYTFFTSFDSFSLSAGSSTAGQRAARALAASSVCSSIAIVVQALWFTCTCRYHGSWTDRTVGRTMNFKKFRISWAGRLSISMHASAGSSSTTSSSSYTSCTFSANLRSHRRLSGKKFRKRKLDVKVVA